MATHCLSYLREEGNEEKAKLTFHTPVAFTMNYKPFSSETANSLNNGSGEQMLPKLNLETEYLLSSDKAKVYIFCKT